MKNVLRIVFHRPLLEKEGNLRQKFQLLELMTLPIWANSKILEYFYKHMLLEWGILEKGNY